MAKKSTKKIAKKAKKVRKKDGRLINVFWCIWNDSTDFIEEGPWWNQSAEDFRNHVAEECALQQLNANVGPEYSIRSFKFTAIGERPKVPDNLIWTR